MSDVPKPRTAWLVPLAAVSAVLFFGSQTVLLNLSAGIQFKWWRVFLPAIFAWTTWAALAPLVFFVARRFPFDAGNRVRAALVHVLVAAALTTVHVFAEYV